MKKILILAFSGIFINSVFADGMNVYNEVLSNPVTAVCMKERVAGVFDPHHDIMLNKTTINPLHRNQSVCAASRNEDYVLIGQISNSQGTITVDSKWIQSYDLSDTVAYNPNHTIAILHANDMHCKGDGNLCDINIWPAQSGDGDGFYLNINT